MSDLTLYELQGCPCCAKMKGKLSSLDLEYESWVVPSAYVGHEEVEEVGDRTGVPVLVDEEHSVKRVPESDDVVGYLEETYGSTA